MTPKLRFPGFSDEWQVKRFNDVFDRVTRKNTENNQNILTISAQRGLVSQEKFFSKLVAAKNVTNYYLLHRNDYAYNKSYSSGYPMGAIKRLYDEDKGVVSALYICFSAKNKGNEEFLDQYFESGRHNSEIEMIAQEGARNHGLLNMSVGDFFQTNLKIPGANEQQKIATFLTAIDKKTAWLEKKTEKLQDYKRGVMQKIFNQKIRFTQDDGSAFPDWVNKKLCDISSHVNVRNKSDHADQVLTNSAVHGILPQSDFFDKDIAVQGNLSNYYVVEKNDFIYNPRISVTAPVGPFKRNNFGQGVMSPLYVVFRFDDKNLDYIEQYFMTNLWYGYMKSVANYGARHDRMAISLQDLKNLPIPYPELEEQKKIADFLSAIDDKICLAKSQAEKTKQFKKALLQRMFI